MSAVAGFILKKRENKLLVMSCGLPEEILKCQQKSRYCLWKITYVYICFKICRYEMLTGPYIGTDDKMLTGPYIGTDDKMLTGPYIGTDDKMWTGPYIGTDDKMWTGPYIGTAGKKYSA